MSLNLVPNEVVGYRIQPDTHSYNVVVVKRYGDTSQRAGQEYETPLAYCKSIHSAALWLLSYATRVIAEASQKEVEAISGSVADAKSLQRSFSEAEARVMQAVAELDTRMQKAGISLPQVNAALNGK